MSRRKWRRWHNWCAFGKHTIPESAGRAYIYPIPVCDAYPDGCDPSEGAIACNECAPAIKELQKKQGLVESASYGFTNGS